MAIDLFGFTIGRKEEIEKLKSDNLKSFVPPQDNDGALEVAPGGVYGTYVDLEGTAKSEAELVTRYREMSTQPEADLAIDDIVNEAIVYNEKDPAVSIVLDDLKASNSIKNRIRMEFDKVLRLLHFTTNAYEVFRRWYIDGRLYYHIVIDEKNPRDGIQELRQVDPRKIRKIKQPIKSKDDKMNAIITKGYLEYYIYHPRGINRSNQGLKISKDSVIFVHTGLLDNRMSMVLGHLHKAIKPLNQLRMLEDATVIYRLARAPERRIFYIDVGNLPKMKAEQYLRDMMVKHKNKLTYDAQTGEVKDDRKFMTMLEDFWLPRREGGRSTEITTLPGGQNLGEMEDVEYFKKKLYKALNVPISRMESEATFNLGRSTEISRDEIKFSKFIKRLRVRFTTLFNDLLEIHLALKGITTRKEYKQLRKNIFYNFEEDNHFTELKEAEIQRERLQLLGDIDNYVGKYYSQKWVQKNIIRMNEDEINDIQKEIEDEKANEPAEFEQVKVTKPVIEEIKEEKFVPKKYNKEEKELIKNMTKALEEVEEDE